VFVGARTTLVTSLDSDAELLSGGSRSISMLLVALVLNTRRFHEVPLAMDRRAFNQVAIAVLSLNVVVLSGALQATKLGGDGDLEGSSLGSLGDSANSVGLALAELSVFSLAVNGAFSDNSHLTSN